MDSADTNTLIDGVVEDLLGRVVAADPGYPLNLEDGVRSTDNETNAWLLIFGRVKKKLYACLGRRNAQSVFNSLPLDIGLCIFMHAVADFVERRNYYEKLFVLRSVCSAWRTFIDDNPELWTVISPRASPLLHDLTIPRARTLPLELHYPLFTGMTYQQDKCKQLVIGKNSGAKALKRFGGVDGHRGVVRYLRPCFESAPTSPPSFPDALLACLKELHWPLGSFHFYDPNNDEAYPLLELFLASPAPNLHTLELTTLINNRTLSTLFSGYAPVLRHVCLKHVVLKSTNQPFAHLQRLKLVEVHGLTTSRLLHLLSHCLNLQQLKMEALYYDEAPDSHPLSDTTTPLSLPRLQTLELERTNTRDIGTLLEGLSIPNATKIHLDIAEQPQGLEGLFGVVQRSFQMSRGARIIDVASRRSHDVTIAGDNWDITIHSPNCIQLITEESYIDLLTTHLSWPEAIARATMSFTASGTFWAKPSVLDGLNTLFPSLQELVFDEYTREIGDVLSEHLGSRPDEQKVWTFPNLHTIKITTPPDVPDAVHALEALIEVVEGRCRGQAPVPIKLVGLGLAEQAPELAEPLERLRQLVHTVVDVVERDEEDEEFE